MQNYDFFNSLSNEEQTYLKEHSKYVEVPKESILFYQGDVCQDVLLLEEGKVRLYISAGLNEEVSLYEIAQGEQCIINTSSTLSQTEAIATAATLSDIKGWLVPKEVLKALMLRSNAYQTYIFSLFSLKFNALTTLIEDIKFKRLDQRVLEFLKSQEQSLIVMTHEELANELSTSRVVISRILKDLERQEYIKLHRGKIEVL